MLPATAWLNCECDKGGGNAGEILSPTSRAILPTVAHAPAPPSHVADPLLRLQGIMSDAEPLSKIVRITPSVKSRLTPFQSRPTSPASAEDSSGSLSLELSDLASLSSVDTLSEVLGDESLSNPSPAAPQAAIAADAPAAVLPPSPAPSRTTVPTTAAPTPSPVVAVPASNAPTPTALGPDPPQAVVDLTPAGKAIAPIFSQTRRKNVPNKKGKKKKAKQMARTYTGESPLATVLMPCPSL